MKFILFPYLFFSFITLLVLGYDKWQASRNGWRVSEKRLHLLELLGGWPGSLLGQQLFRHKRSKDSYQREFRKIIALHWLVLLLFLTIWLVLL